MTRPDWPLIWRGGLVVLLLIGLGALAAHNLGYPGVWYDEAVQIWVAQGVFPFSPAGEALGGWRDVVRMNRRANLDPGGYSLLLHLWSEADRGLVWLRFSAFFFHLLAAALLARYAWELTGSGSAALLAPFVLFAYGLVLSFAFEIRAYSMEVAGVIATGYALHRTVRAPSLGNHLALGVVCAAFLWSRYSFVVVAVAALAALAGARAWRLGRPRDELENLACLLVPVLDSGAMVYRASLRHHLAGHRLAAMQAPDYVKQWVLEDQPLAVVAATFRENFFSSAALPITLALATLALWPWRHRWPPLSRWPGAGSFAAMATMALLVQLISAVLSARGAYPWNIGQKWSLYLHGVSIVCLLYLGSACWCAWRSSRWAPILAAAVLTVAAVLTARAATFHRRHWADVSSALTHLSTIPVRPDSVFVTVHEVPGVRYLYELGPFRGVGRYPGVFRFERTSEHRTRAPIDAKQECLEYVVSPAPLETLAERMPGARLARVPGPAPASLVRIEADGPRPAHCSPREASPGSGR